MSDTLKSTSLYDETTPVLIVGGGLVGLSTSLFLSWHGIHSLLVERHPSTAIHPRAIGMTPRTMELFHSVGAVEEIRKVESPFPEESNVLLVESLVGQVFDNLQDEAELGDLFIGPVPGSAIAQDVLEPVLRARAECLGGICASEPNWWHLSRMRRASRPRSANGQARARARFAPSFWWRLTAATAGFVKSSASASMEQRACFIASV